jgi:hypothetical protein
MATATTPATPTNDDGALAVVLRQIRDTREDVGGYLRTTSRRGQRLVAVTIIAGAMATVLTAAPALGGESLADWLTETFALAAPSWQILCAVAAACSLAATVATQLHQSNHYDARIAAAQRVQATLDVLEAAIESGQLDRQEAIGRYLAAVEKASLIVAGGSPGDGPSY